MATTDDNKKPNAGIAIRAEKSTPPTEAVEKDRNDSPEDELSKEKAAHAKSFEGCVLVSEKVDL